MTALDRGLLVDSGYFIALFDPRDRFHEEAVARRKWIDALKVILPWPILYETVNTRFARRPDRIRGLQNVINQSNSMLVDDSPYRRKAFDAMCEMSEFRPGISLVDAVLMELIKERNVKIEVMLTFNHRDFRNVCAENGIEYLCEPSAPGSRA